MRVDGNLEVEQKSSFKHSAGTEATAGATLKVDTPHKPELGVQAGTKCASSNEGSFELKTGKSGAVRYYVHFGSVQSSLLALMQNLEKTRFWILLDEWSTLPLDLQPILADLLKRSILPVRGITVKIAAIEQRSRFKIDGALGAYIGLEIGADIPSDINLDDFMVFENQPERARDFYKRLFFNHFKTSISSNWTSTPHSEDALVSQGFTQVNVFDQLVQAAEGVPRDA